MNSVAQGAATKVPDLLDLLAPGEVGLYWDYNGRRRWVSIDTTVALACSVVGAVLFLALSVYAAAIQQQLLLSLLSGAFFLVFGLISIFQRRQLRQLPPRCDALITETRLLYWHEDTSLSVVEIPMTEIAAAEELSSGDGSVQIVKRDGSEIVLTGLEHSGRFARLLPVKPELTPSESAIHFRNRDGLYLSAAQLAFPFVLGLLLLAQNHLTGAKPQVFEWIYTFLYLFPAAAAVCLAGLHVARLSTFLNGWRSHDPEAVRFWLWPPSYDSERERRVLEWVLLNPLYRRLAIALYGPSISGAQEKSHG